MKRATEPRYDPSMSGADPFAARLIESCAPAFAAMAATRMLELDPSLGERFAPDAFSSWKQNLAFRLRELASALAEGDPEGFAREVCWARTAFLARKVPVSDLRASLECLREVLLVELPDQVRPALARFLELAIAAFDQGLALEPPRAPGDLVCEKLAGRYLEALLRGSRREASQVVLEAVRAGAIDARKAMLDVLFPAQYELGAMWHRNEIGVAHEHFGTATTRMVIHQLAADARPRPENGRCVLTATACGDAHEIGIAVVSLLFELDGWRVVHLGCDVPSDEVLAGVEEFRPDLLALSATLEAHRRALGGLIGSLRERSPTRPLPVLVGGLAFQRDPESWRRTGADAHAARADDAVEVGRRLLGLA